MAFRQFFSYRFLVVIKLLSNDNCTVFCCFTCVPENMSGKLLTLLIVSIFATHLRGHPFIYNANNNTYFSQQIIWSIRIL